MKKTIENISTLAEIRRQKQEVLKNIRQEQENIKEISSVLFHPFLRQERREPQTLVQNVSRMFSTFGYTIRLTKGILSVLKIFH